MSVVSLDYIDTRHLPALCRAPRCHNDPAPGDIFCHRCIEKNKVVQPDNQLEPGNTWLYVIQSKQGGPVKIGVSKVPERRVKDLQVAQPYELVLLGCIQCRPFVEMELHEVLKDSKTQDEWFDLSAETQSVINAVQTGDIDSIFAIIRGALYVI